MMTLPKIEALCLFAAFVWLAPFSLRAQTTNRAALMREATSRMVWAAPPTATRSLTNPAGRAASVEVKLPQDLRRYHIVEQRGQTTHVATNLTVIATNHFRATLAPESTLMFVEKEPPASVKANARVDTRALFATYMLKSTPSARPGEPHHTAS